jgi:hypothetical protein
MSLSLHPIRALLFSDIHRFVMHSALWRFLYLVSLVCGILFGQIYNSTIQHVVYSRQCRAMRFTTPPSIHNTSGISEPEFDGGPVRVDFPKSGFSAAQHQFQPRISDLKWAVSQTVIGLPGVVQFHHSQFAVQMATVALTPFHWAKGHYGDGDWSPARPGCSCKRGGLGPAPGRSRVRTGTRSAFALQGLVSEIASGRCFSVNNQERDVSLEESSRFQESIFCTPFLARCRVLDQLCISGTEGTRNSLTI